jgi:propionyl-CoA synthetase
LSAHPDVAECAVVGVADEIKGEVPVGFVVTKAGVSRPDGELVRELVDRIRQQIGPVAAFTTALVVTRLPKTRSGKILRGTMKRIADSQAYAAPATIDDPAILGEITAALRGAGYAKGKP